MPALPLLFFQIQSCMYCNFEGVPEDCILHPAAIATLNQTVGWLLLLHFVTVTQDFLAMLAMTEGSKIQLK